MNLVTAVNDAPLLAALESQHRIGIDTEFMRERTYFAQLCLLQIATTDTIFCVDPLVEGDLDSCWDTLMRRDWVLHSGRQDIEVVYQATGRMPTSLFDTQVAAALLGFAPQMGYATLVNELFGVELSKSQTRADWSRRPLSDAMLHYAGEDVEYLLDACDLLCERLAALDRLEWAKEDSLFLLDKSLYDIDADAAVDKLKGARNLRGRARRAAVGLAGWRENRALRSNRPRRWILKDAVLIEMAQSNPQNERDLAAVTDMPAATVRNAARDLLKVLRDAENGADNYVPPSPPGERQKSLLKEMQKRVSALAEELDIAAEILAPRKELAAAVDGRRDSRMFGGWRRDVVGRPLQELLD